MNSVAVLFARKDSVYKTLPYCDVFDKERDARNFRGTMPIVAHPPCAQWGTLRHMSRNIPEEKALALEAVGLVRTNGGVLEHPKRSTLWDVANLPAPGAPADKYGGWTLAVSQKWFGHRAEKQTLLYIVGCKPSDIPTFPITLGEAHCVVGTSGRRKDGTRKDLPEISKAEREHTPKAFAEWLCELAKRCKKP